MVSEADRGRGKQTRQMCFNFTTIYAVDSSALPPHHGALLAISTSLWQLPVTGQFGREGKCVCVCVCVCILADLVLLPSSSWVEIHVPPRLKAIGSNECASFALYLKLKPLQHFFSPQGCHFFATFKEGSSQFKQQTHFTHSVSGCFSVLPSVG